MQVLRTQVQLMLWGVIPSKIDLAEFLIVKKPSPRFGYEIKQSKTIQFTLVKLPRSNVIEQTRREY